MKVDGLQLMSQRIEKWVTVSIWWLEKDLIAVSACVRKIKTDKQSQSWALVTVMIAFHPVTFRSQQWSLHAPKAFLPQGQVAVKWFSVSPSQYQNHHGVDFSLNQWLLFMGFSVLTNSKAIAVSIHISSILWLVWFPFFNGTLYQRHTQIISSRLFVFFNKVD